MKRRIYSYIFVFSRYLNIDVKIPPNISLITDVSVRDSNETIIKRLGITTKQINTLELETLRKDAKKKRQQRYRQNKYGSLPKQEYKEVLKNRRQEIFNEYLVQKEVGISTTQIAKNLNMSRGRLYQIITTKRNEDI